MRPRIALLLQLSHPLPPPPPSDAEPATPLGRRPATLLTALRWSPFRFAAHLEEHGHPTVRTPAEYERAAATGELLASAMEWEAGRIAEAQRAGLIPATLVSSQAGRE